MTDEEKYIQEYLDIVIQYKNSGGQLNWTMWLQFNDVERQLWQMAEIESQKDKMIIYKHALDNPYYIEERMQEANPEDQGLSLRERIVEEELDKYLAKQEQEKMFRKWSNQNQKSVQEFEKDFKRVTLNNVKQNLKKK